MLSDPRVIEFPMRAAVLALLLSFAFCSLASHTHAASPVGKWRGSWSSQSTGHRGPLRASIRRTGPDTYRAVFVGRFAVVVPFVYPAKLERVPGTCDCYSSTQRLPLAGRYEMKARITPQHFNATFESARDRGKFEMSR